MEIDKLLKLEGYVFKSDGIATEDDIDDIESKLIELLEENGFRFCGTSRIEDND